jgi:putative Holliday junction resolvase
VRVLALDYGRARTGVAVSDPTGTLARPLAVVERAGEAPGLDRLAALVAERLGSACRAVSSGPSA